ncbi:hypothetical protein RJ55_01652 [Drechmeria coniospora]|nr:hypothetical protein RJ55_01652 [Drechmeria coniospora]
MSDAAPLPVATSSAPAALRSALKSDDDAAYSNGSIKAVQIAEPSSEPFPDVEAQPPRRFRASSFRRHGAKSTFSPLSAASPRACASDASSAVHAAEEQAQLGSQHHHQSHHRSQHYGEKLLAQVGEWLEREKQKAAVRRKKPTHRRKSKSPPVDQHQAAVDPISGRQRSPSVDSQSSDVSLGRLESILADSMAQLGLTSIPKHAPKVSRPKRRPPFQRAASSDTDYVDGDAIVPDCDAWLDNSKTLGYSGGGVTTDDLDEKAEKEREAWLSFKNEIIRIAHTLRLKGWRRVPLESGTAIVVERLSGALTNAVYVVTPPKEMTEVDGKKPPPKLLLRIYGPQVEHLIDRDNELKVLQRLARKKIGPRLLGTFRNGRFEQYFNAITLNWSDLREPETSRQIAKRMRELHDGIDLLPSERENGAGVWKNWDQWLDNVAKITKFLDAQLEAGVDSGRADSVAHAWMSNGHVCGVPWPQFLDIVTKYRSFLESSYKDEKTVKDRLVFAHSDTQYGNILRFRPDDEKSPLLQAANKHKQLIVIDFEYAAANTPGLEFANHFTEWAYNYHDLARPHACNTTNYPTLEEQKRFIKAYVDHRSQFPNASLTPRIRPADSGVVSTPPLVPTASSSSIIDFMLDARAPPGGWGAAERDHEEQTEKQVGELLEEARLWRPGNSAQWVAWGIVQAKVPGLDANYEPLSEKETLEAEQGIGADEFDYLGYAQERAMFFWGDVLQMGLVKEEELPESLLARIKIVPY